MIVRQLTAVVELEEGETAPTGSPRDIARAVLVGVRAAVPDLEITEMSSREQGSTRLRVTARTTVATAEPSASDTGHMGTR